MMSSTAAANLSVCTSFDDGNTNKAIDLSELETPSTSNSFKISKRKLLVSTPGTSMKKLQQITNYVDVLQENEEEKISNALAKFIFGCSLPFSVVESPVFKNFIKTIRPAYLDSLPGRKKLCTTLLDKCYAECVEKSCKKFTSESVILCDGWKNSSSNTKTVVTMLHSVDGENAFLNAWDLTTESETAEKFAEILYVSQWKLQKKNKI